MIDLNNGFWFEYLMNKMCLHIFIRRESDLLSVSTKSEFKYSLRRRR